ncbi:MAG: anthranilate synthase component I family protein [Limisphaera sp.]|nr:anthranilate synthase component I family protein [Limisphaera sp.]
MQLVVREWRGQLGLEELARRLAAEPGVVFLKGGWPDAQGSRYSYLVADPFLTLTIQGSRLEWQSQRGGAGPERVWVDYGNPWRVLQAVWDRFELLDEPDLPFPLGGLFGFWGYELNRFVEPAVAPRARRDLEVPDGWVGFYDSVVVWDHCLGRGWILSAGLCPDGSRLKRRALERADAWERRLAEVEGDALADLPERGTEAAPLLSGVGSTLSREAFLRAVERVQEYIRQGHIYQVNLSQRLMVRSPIAAWEMFRRLWEVSPAPYAAYLNGGPFQLVSASPELFLQMSASQILTRPIKGTRPRGAAPEEDAQLALELQASPKENAELVMITDLLRNDLGRICEFGSVHVPELARLESYPQVHHLVSTVEGRLRPGVSHLEALAATFPGGSVTGAPKVRAMQIIEEVEPVARHFFTGALGFLGFNRESRLSMIIRTACCLEGWVHFPVGAGIVADSDPESEYRETLAKAGGFLAALGWGKPGARTELAEVDSSGQG